MDIQKNNQVKSKLYKMFHGKVETDVIDLFLQNCDYNYDKTYQILIEMIADKPDDIDDKHDDMFFPLQKTRSRPSKYRGSPNLEPMSIVEVDSVYPVETPIQPEKIGFEMNLGRGAEPTFPKPTSEQIFDEVDGKYKRRLNGYPHLSDSFRHYDTAPQYSPLQNMQKIQPYEEQQIKEEQLDRQLQETIRQEIIQNPFQKEDVIPRIPICQGSTGVSFEKYRDPRMLWMVILRGLPGSGKSTMARNICGDKGLILSTDDFFMKNGRYTFDPHKLSEAHNWNQKRATDALQDKISPIVIDNTNVEIWQMKPYCFKAQIFKYFIDILEPDTPWAWDVNELARRNKHHVQKTSIVRMKEKYDKNVTVENILGNDYKEPQKPKNDADQIYKPLGRPEVLNRQILQNIPPQIASQHSPNQTDNQDNISLRKEFPDNRMNSLHVSPGIGYYDRTDGETKLSRSIIPPQSYNGPSTTRSLSGEISTSLENRWLILMRGLPGSGKTTRAKELCGENGIILSNDDFFMEKDGSYDFDDSRDNEAREWNEMRAKNAFDAQISPVIIDNNNLQLWEMKPYVYMGLNYGYTIKFEVASTHWAWRPSELCKKTIHKIDEKELTAMRGLFDRKCSVEGIMNSTPPPIRSDLDKNDEKNNPFDSVGKEYTLESKNESTIKQIINPIMNHNYASNDTVARDIPSQHGQPVPAQRPIPKPRPPPNVAMNDTILSSSDHEQNAFKQSSNTLPGSTETYDNSDFNNKPLPFVYNNQVENETQNYNNSFQLKEGIGNNFQQTSGLSSPYVQLQQISGPKSSYIQPQQILGSTTPYQSQQVLGPRSLFQSQQIPGPRSSYIQQQQQQQQIPEPGSPYVQSQPIPGLRSPFIQQQIPVPGSPYVKSQPIPNLRSPFIQPQQIPGPRSPFISGSESPHFQSQPIPEPSNAQLKTPEPMIVDYQDGDEDNTTMERDKQLKNPSGSALTTKQIGLRDLLHQDFPHVDRDSLNQLLESCSYNYESASNFVKYSVGVSPNKGTRKKKKKLKKNSQPSPAESSVAASSTTSRDDSPDDETNMEFLEPPTVNRMQQDQQNFSKNVDFDIPDGGVSTGRLGDIVESYKSNIKLRSSEKISAEDDENTSSVLNTDEFNNFMEYNLKFLYECFPDFPKPYCKKWLKLYSGDLVKTCDYLSRVSQLEDLPDDARNGDEDIIDSSNEDVINDDIDTNDDILSARAGSSKGACSIANEELKDRELSSKLKESKRKRPFGQVFHIEDENDVNKDEVTMAIDKSLVIELMKRFAKDPNEDELNVLDQDDFIFDLDKKTAEMLFTAWNTNVTKRRRLGETEPPKVVEASKISTKKKNKKKKGKAHPIEIKINDKEPAQIQGEGIFSPYKVSQGANQDVATKNKNGDEIRIVQLEAREKFYHMFPGLPEESLDEILEASNYDLENAATLVTQSTGAEKNTENLDAANGWKVVVSPVRRRTTQPADENSTQQQQQQDDNDIIDGYQTLREGDQSYQDYRAEAEIHANLRREFYTKAAQAYQAKQGYVAQYYADKAKEHTKKMKDAHFRAAEMILMKTNKAYMKEQRVIDLHGLHADEAERALYNFLENAERIGHREVKVITGRGNHSKNGVSTIRNAVIKFLEKEAYNYQMKDNGGSFIIKT